MFHLLYLGPPDTTSFVQECLGSEWNICHATSESAVDAVIGDTDAVLDAYMAVPFPQNRIDRAGKLKLFTTATTGFSHIDHKRLEARKIPLLTLKGERELLKNITPAAELSWLLLMACARGFRSAIEDVQAGIWDRNKHPGMMLRGRQLGLIGCGRIGQWMSRYATAFGMKVVGYDPAVSPWPESIEKSELIPLLETSDFVSIHVNLTDETKGLVGADQINRMKKGAVLINTSRGELIDESAVLDALKEGRLSGAGLDVLTCEPRIQGDPLYEFSREFCNLHITPHIGGFSPDALRNVLSFCCRRLAAHFGTPVHD
jgi:phosphoglycerate dehydrogenase-like enzyme